ncbi:MAG: hypothetical protein JXB10_14880 [Pirellulales bacterium]|nr:hypothetical protein [Pirellulales bacterium]
MHFCRCWLSVIILGVLGDAAQGQSAWYEGFEGGAVTWREAGRNASYRLLKHQRLRGPDAHTGQGCEWLQVAAEGNMDLYWGHDVGRPRVIEELMPSVWIKSDRPGAALLARVVLPRTLDRRTQRPVATLLGGTSYNDVGRWQQLRVSDVPQLLTRQIQMLRTQLGPEVDGREAYVDAVFLHLYGGPGVANVWIDDLDVAGYVGLGPTAAEGNAGGGGRTGPPANPVSLTPPRRLPAGASANLPAPAPSFSPSPASHEIKFSGSILSIDGHAFFPRAIEYRGEPLGYLKQLGFNTIWLSQVPGPELLEEATRWGLWVVCPPPRPRAGQPPAPGRSPIEVEKTYDPVLMWNLGDQLAAEQLEATRIGSRQIRAADVRMARPLICRPIAESRGYSRLVDFLLIDRRPVGTSLEMSDYGTWLRRQPLLARPGTPVWTTLQTQLAESWQRQVAALSTLPPPNHDVASGEGRGEGPPSDAVDYEQLRLMAYAAVASGTRGLLFLSSRPLNAPDPAARQRAVALELLNLELAMLEPWGAAGKFVATAESTPNTVEGTVLRTEHARLLLPLTFAPGAQYTVGASAVPQLALTVPGVPEACNAYEMTPIGLQPLGHKRVAGGTRIDFNRFALTTQVLLANDPLILAGVTRRVAELGRRAGQLQRELAAEKLQRLQTLIPTLGLKTSAGPKSGQWLDAAAKSLQDCDRQLAANDLSVATRSSAYALLLLRQAERSYWEFAAAKVDSPVTSPPAVSFATLPLHWRLIEWIGAARFGPNRLAGGDFEDFQQMMNLGWRHGVYPGPDLRAEAALAPGCAHAGKLGLRLSVMAQQPENAPVMIESATEWFASPPLPVTAGQVLCVHGWINVPRPVTGSVDGLMIYDSLGGEALAQRVGKTTGWQEFALYRIAPQDGALTMIFALTGLGEAWIDDVQVQVLEGGVSRQ